jgi:hypothetical protein
MDCTRCSHGIIESGKYMYLRKVRRKRINNTHHGSYMKAMFNGSQSTATCMLVWTIPGFYFLNWPRDVFHFFLIACRTIFGTPDVLISDMHMFMYIVLLSRVFHDEVWLYFRWSLIKYKCICSWMWRLDFFYRLLMEMLRQCDIETCNLCFHL